MYICLNNFAWCLPKSFTLKGLKTLKAKETQFSVNTNTQISCNEISYTSRSQHLAFRSTYVLIFEGKSSVHKYYFVLGINRALCSIFSCFFTLSHEPPTPLRNFYLWTPSPSELPVTFRWGGGYGYFLEPHNLFSRLTYKGNSPSASQLFVLTRMVIYILGEMNLLVHENLFLKEYHMVLAI